MRHWMLGTALLLALIALTMASPAAAQGCMIMTNLGPAPDYDCDGVIDQLDNCPGAPNAQQYDMNRNGIGDACDLLIEEIIVNPDGHVRQGGIARLTVRLANNHETAIQDITVNVRNKDLGIDVQDSIAMIPRGEVAVLDFWLLVPKCAKVKTYDLSVSATSGAGPAETQVERLIVENGSVCGTPDSAMDTTVIQMPHELDIDAGGAAIIPITINNLGDKQATYDLSVADLGPFATWRIDPAPRMTLAAGHADTAYLYLQTEERIEPGRRTVEFTVTSGNQKTTVPLSVYVRQYRQQSAPPFLLIMQIIFIILLLILIIAAIIVAVRAGKRRKPDREHDRYVHIDDLKKDDDGAAAKVNDTNSMKTVKETKVVKAKTAKTVAIEDADGKKLETYY